MIDYAGLMTKAYMLREKLGEDNRSPIDIFSVAQNIDGLTIVFYPMGDNLSGMCIKGQDGNDLVAINSGMTLGRQRFSLAHEFYHLYYDKNMVSVCNKKINSGAETEKCADIFATYFLMPDAALVNMADRLANDNPDLKLNLYDIIRIEQYFGVSHQAAVYRLMNMRYLDADRGNEYLNFAVRHIAEKIGYRDDLYRPAPESRRYMTYGNYISQAEKLYSNDLISSGKYDELLLDAFRTDLVYGDSEEEGDLID